MTFPDISADLQAKLPELRGRIAAGTKLADITWFRVGGPAQALFSPADEADLAYFLAGIPARPARYRRRPWLQPAGARRRRAGRRHPPRQGLCRHHAGAGQPHPRRHGGADVKVARAAADAGIAGLAFYRGIPGSIGGALRMNAGAHGRETKDVLIEARAVDRAGNIHVLSLADMGFTYRHSEVPDDWILTEALYQGSRRRARRHPQGDGRGRRLSREEPADPRAHRRLDLQEPAGPQRLEADRRGRLPRLARRRRQGLRDALQLPHQRRRRQGRGHRAPGRDGARARQGALGHLAAMGDHPHGPAAARLPHGRSAGQADVMCTGDGAGAHARATSPC